jgi:hypothetical protein
MRPGGPRIARRAITLRSRPGRVAGWCVFMRGSNHPTAAKCRSEEKRLADAVSKRMKQNHA